MIGEEETFRSGFVTLVGRPNVGKSTLLNRLVGQKVSIVSDRPQTTRNQIRGVLGLPGVQAVFIDTPGIHKPRTELGRRLNQRSLETLGAVDVVCFLVEAKAAIGSGDRFIAGELSRLATPVILVVNKVDAATPAQIAAHLAEATRMGDFDAYVPLSAVTGEGVEALMGEILPRLPPGPRYYPDDVVSDQPDAFLAAEIVREKLLARAREELPHSLAVTVEEIEERPDLLAIRAVIRVERESQKAIVIGKGGSVLKEVGTEARAELEALLGSRIHLETHVKVDKDWQRRPEKLDRLGY
jgi:GTP-binding protein Era